MIEKIESILSQCKSTQFKPYQQNLIEKFINNFLTNNSVDVDSILNEDMVCRSCGRKHFVKNGKKNNIQRYKCKSCGVTQSNRTNSPLYRMRLTEKWVDFVYLMLENATPLSLKEISEELEINVKTAFTWRHKFLASLNQTNQIEIDNEVELDEVYLPYNVIGVIGKEKYKDYVAHKSPLNVESELRLKEKQLIKDKSKAIFMCVHNRDGDFDFIPLKIQKKGHVPSKIIKKAVETIDITNKNVITDMCGSMKTYMDSVDNVNHLTFNSGDVKKGKMIDKNIHNNNINNVMSHLRDWFKNFFGFSTKYIWNYLKWFRYIKLFKQFQIEETCKQALSDMDSNTRFFKIFNYYEEYMAA